MQSVSHAHNVRQYPAGANFRKFRPNFVVSEAKLKVTTGRHRERSHITAGKCSNIEL
jgi:hypothetical protein